MVRLLEMPPQDVIDGFKGTIDYYLWKGIPCARSWPVYHPRQPYPSERTNQEAFSTANHLWPTLDEASQQTYFDLATGTGLSPRDMFVRAYMKGLYRYPTP